ncbi:MAG: AroM family protein [Acidobacteriota bacterium]
MAKTVGAITIGQSGRGDIIPEMSEISGKGIEFIEAGALDGFSFHQIEQLKPGEGEHTLITRLKDGRAVKVAKERIIPLVQACVDNLTGQGVDLLTILCTGQFPKLETSRLIIYPSQLLRCTVEALTPLRKLGIIVPLPEQIESSRKRWHSQGREVILESATPYGDVERLREAAQHLSALGVELIVLDCMGFDRRMKQIVLEEANKPVLLPRSLLAQLIGELLT